MERLTIDEIIAHCKRRVRREEALNGRDFFETELMGHYHMQEYWEHRQVAEYLEELKEYRKAEEQGLLLRLPCKVGEKIYYSSKTCGVMTFTIVKIEIYEDEILFEDDCENIWEEKEFGETVFLTREEAEAALAEKGGAE